MLNICKKMIDDNNACDSIAAGAQIGLFSMCASDEGIITAK